MSFDWSSYLSLAKKLSSGEGSALEQEAKLRSAISRSYYAAFKVAHNGLRDRDGDSQLTESNRPKFSIHAHVIGEFEDSRDMKRKQIAFKLKALRQERRKADYSDEYSDIVGQSVHCIKYSSQVLSLLAEVFPSLAS